MLFWRIFSQPFQLFPENSTCIISAFDYSNDMEVNQDKFDEIVLALLHFNSWQDKFAVFAWKSLDWDALARLHEKGLISDPRSKAKSVLLTEEGNILAKQLFEKYFKKNKSSD